MTKFSELSEKNYDKEIIAFFKNNPNPPDDKVHDLADELGIEADDLESQIYALLTSYIKK